MIAKRNTTIKLRYPYPILTTIGPGHAPESPQSKYGTSIDLAHERLLFWSKVNWVSVEIVNSEFLY